MSIYSIFKNRISNPTKTLFADLSHKNIKIGFNRFISSTLKGTNLSKKAEKKVQNLILDKLKFEFEYVFDKYQNYQFDSNYDKNSPVWVCWLQGIDKAPQLVKKCVESIKESTNHPVNILSLENIENYIKLPNYILDKYNKNIITNAQLSDIIRMALLSNYGGLWIDATIFIPNTIPEEIFKNNFYTCKRIPNDSGYISKNRWTAFLNGCQYGCIIQKVMCELFFEYWKKEDYLIDYLLVDLFMCLIYDNIPYAKKLIDELPYNNSNIESLQENMNNEYNNKKYQEIIRAKDTYFYKLSWRMYFKNETSDGKPTFFKMFIENKI